MTSLSDINDRAFTAGYTAYCDGVPLSANPLGNRAGSAAWAGGWMAAQSASVALRSQLDSKSW